MSAKLEKEWSGFVRTLLAHRLYKQQSRGMSEARAATTALAEVAHALYEASSVRGGNIDHGLTVRCLGGAEVCLEMLRDSIFVTRDTVLRDKMDRMRKAYPSLRKSGSL